MSWIDLRFKSWSEEKAFKKGTEEILIYAALATTVFWHTLLLVPAFLDHISLEHVLLLPPACIVVALALFRLLTGWFRSLNWELIFLVFGCSTMLVFPVVAKSYLDSSDLVGLQQYLKALYAFQGLSHTIILPFRASLSWVVLLSHLIAALVMTFHEPPEHTLEVLYCCLASGTSVLCWCAGWLLEKRARVIWQTHHHGTSKLASVLPEVNQENHGVATSLGKTDSNAKEESLLGVVTPVQSMSTLQQKRHYLRVGASLPDFDLKTTLGNFKLSEYLHSKTEMPWTILFSHPADFTPACTTEMGTCEEMVSKFAAAGVKMIGLSCDSVESHLAWTKDVLARSSSSSTSLGFPIIADEDRRIVTTLGLLDPQEKSSEGFPLPARALVLLYNSTVRLTSLYPASCGRDFENIALIKQSLKPFYNMSSLLPAASNPLAVGETMPNFTVATTEGELHMHQWLLADKANPWTIFLSYPNANQGCVGWDKLLQIRRKLGCKIIALTCEKGINNWRMCGSEAFPVILDHDRQIASMLDMLDENFTDDEGSPDLVSTLVVLHGTTVRLSEIHPSSVSHNFDELSRILSSFHVTQSHRGLVTPANWKQGNPVLVHPSVSSQEAQARFQNLQSVHLPSGKDYLRTVSCPDN